MISTGLQIVLTRLIYVIMFGILVTTYISLDNKIKSCEKEKNLLAAVIGLIFLAFIISLI